MCLSSIYTEIDGKRALLMNKAACLEPIDDEIVCHDFLGRVIRFQGSIKSIDLNENIIILQKNKNE